LEFWKNIETRYLLVNCLFWKKTREEIVRIFKIYREHPLKDIIIKYLTDNEHICFETELFGIETKVCIEYYRECKDLYNYALLIQDKDDNMLLSEHDLGDQAQVYSNFEEMMNTWLNLEKDYVLKDGIFIKRSTYDIYEELKDMVI
jgi:hypothetical protein